MSRSRAIQRGISQASNYEGVGVKQPTSARINEVLTRVTGLELHRAGTVVPAKKATQPKSRKRAKTTQNKIVAAKANANPANKTSPVTAAPSSVRTLRRPRPPDYPLDDLRHDLETLNTPEAQARIASIIGPAQSPVALLGTVYSGAGELRQALAAHSEIFAPGNIMFTAIHVTLSDAQEPAFMSRRLRPRELEGMLWDHLLRDQFARSGKKVALLNNGGQGFVADWRRLKETWPAARWLHVVRDPVATLGELSERQELGMPDSLRKATAMLDHALDARQQLPGLSIRYEDLRDSPVETLTAVCNFLDVEFEPAVAEHLNLPEVTSTPVDPESLNEVIKSVRSNWGYS